MQKNNPNKIAKQLVSGVSYWGQDNLNNRREYQIFGFGNYKN